MRSAARPRTQPGAGRGPIAEAWHGNRPRSRLQELRSEALMVPRSLRPVGGPSFVVLTSGRSGSELLRSLMGAHPLVYHDVEILDRDVWFPHRWVASRRARHRDRAWGFKVKLQDLTRFQRPALDPARFLGALADDGYRIIHLRRENVVLQSLSVLRARATGEYHRAADAAVDGRRPIDVAELVAACGHQMDWMDRELEALAGLDRLTVTYEADLDDPTRHQATADRIFDHLGLDRVPVATHLTRTRPRSVTDEIVNLDEVRTALAGIGLLHQLPAPTGGPR
ncbi:MAG TPA: Stf0 family sulfotransferase [Iamia sp.]|nr:Stf0 family sulfotransferase [Iamia sp.]